jgi:diketogulonate reductase-like aldo/keto reductase
MNRRQWLQHTGIIGLAMMSPVGLSLPMQSILKRKIPSTGELLPVVGLGTWQTFDVGSDEIERGPLREVLQTLVANGASVVDSSPMYGKSEAIVGELSSDLGLNDKLFIATKVWTNGLASGKKQIDNSFRVLKRDTIDLIQVHNLVDWQLHLKTLQSMKEAGKIRYIGLTHYLDSAHTTIENIITSNKIDFIQVNYSIASRNAESRVLNAAADHQVAVLINRPFEEGALFNLVRGKQLPEWASDFDCSSWGQFFLKFILSNPNVNCVIPGTSKAKHLRDNLGAGQGKLPDDPTRQKMIALIDDL